MGIVNSFIGFVCVISFVYFLLDDELEKDMATWYAARRLFLKKNSGTCTEMTRPEDKFFTSRKGTPMFSNELARLTATWVGGNVCDMRKAQYHLVISYLS